MLIDFYKGGYVSYLVGALFAGIGGIELGFKKAGLKIAFANEIDKNANITYKSNFKHLLKTCDMRELDPSTLPKVDILVGGFPCQAFSIAGYQKGFNDDRGDIFFDIIRYINALKPEVLFLENVKNLASHDKGRTFKIIQDELNKAGYHIKSAILNTCQYTDIPQNRERIYIVCFKDKNMSEAFKFPKKRENKPRSIRDFLEKNVDDCFYYHNSKYLAELKSVMTNKDTFYQWRRVYVRENKNGLCPTLTANMGMGGHNVPLVLDDNMNIRKITPRECARFQGFDDSFILPTQLSNSALYKQIGNSVSVPVIELIAVQILKVLQEFDKKVA
ncbi:DNA cytosine methyltransferase [Campylobacter sp. faydin G-105]|nr:DNA cytosine methyltransferase [Campylobacter anatolicus]